MTTKQLIELINVSPELKEQLKENYYKIKIQEAKNKKKKIADNKNSLWDLLPPDVEQKILEIKEENDKDYISLLYKENNLTIKSLQNYLFEEYRNEKGQKINRTLATNWNEKKFIWIMINNKEWSEYYYKREESSKSYDATIKHWKDITKNKSPSLFELIEYRKKEKKELSEKRKKQNKERSKEETKTDLKVGDLIYDLHSSGYKREYHQAYIITGETKTQWRVDLLEWDDKYKIIVCQGQTRYKYYLENNDLWNKRKKHKNLTKKSFLKKFEETDKVKGTNRFCIVHNVFYD
jgi:hypothetical protein